MIRTSAALGLALLLCVAIACSPRDFLTRRLAADLIATSDSFKAPQIFWLHRGVLSNVDFNSPDSLVLQRRGWIIGTETKCPTGLQPPPCWDVVLSPAGVDVFRSSLASAAAAITPVKVARRELAEITGISKDGNFADVDFTWNYVPVNDVGSALYDSGVRYRSTVQFRRYDDGWRVVTDGLHSNQSIEDALRNSQPVP